MNRKDKDALQRALVAARAESPGRAWQIDEKLKNETWFEAASFAASCAQSQALRLKPWTCAPCDTNSEVDPAEGDFYGNRPDEVALLKKMLAAGLSRYEPDPMRALAQVEAAKASA